MSENDSTLRYPLSGVSGSEPRGVAGPDIPSPQAEGASTRKPIKQIAQINRSAIRLAAYRITRHLAASEDICQDVFARLLAFPGERLADIECLEAFAAQAARNDARNWRNRRRHHVSMDELAEMEDERFPDPVVPICSEDELTSVLAKLGRLLREPFVLCKIHGYYVEEIAEALGISVAAARKRIQRAFEIVKRHSGAPARTSRIRSLFNRKEQ